MPSDAAPTRTLQPCPSCGLTDQLISVPAAYLAGQQQVHEHVPASDDAPAGTRIRTVTSALAKALAPAPARPGTTGGMSCLTVLVFLAAVALFVAAVLTGHWFRNGFDCPTYGAVPYPYPEHPVAPACPTASEQTLGLLSLLALLGAVVLGVLAVRSNRSWHRLMAGRPHAEALWSRGWYCTRCAVVHFPATAGAAARPIDLAEFRLQVWTAGGYGHLASGRPLH
jgi:hypothetical protein